MALIRNKILRYLKFDKEKLFDIKSYLNNLQTVWLPEITDRNKYSVMERYKHIFGLFFYQKIIQKVNNLLQNMFISTTTDFEIMTEHGKNIGENVELLSPSSGPITLKLDESIALPYTIFKNEVLFANELADSNTRKIYFHLEEDVIFKETDAYLKQVTIYQGKNLETVYLSGTGYRAQELTTGYTNVTNRQIEVYVQEFSEEGEGEWVQWTQATENNLMLHTGDDRIYEIFIDKQLKFNIRCGDGVSYGQVFPSGNSNIKISCYRTNGNCGNLPENKVTKIIPDGGEFSVLQSGKMTNWAAISNIDELRFRILRYARITDRIIKSDDYFRAEQKFPDIDRIYIVPGAFGHGAIGIFVISDNYSSEMAEKIEVYVSAWNSVIEVIVVVAARYNFFSVNAEIWVNNENYDGDKVAINVKQALIDFFSPLSKDSIGNYIMTPGQRIHPSMITGVIKNVPGVRYVEVNTPSTIFSTTVFKLPCIDENNIVITAKEEYLL